eukprot:CAMPEP_0182427890 /NCGR_PEP_ID=MMETSP1167-20130531/20583_1 /TAXON_ID=2988 /ORGANISM="Mallomonas Sp, Strain CCMP3275" /LENGTH=30 /DNA_ID= /DNA_START= /DNA_END= /DNA_ORIENTATION=
MGKKSAKPDIDAILQATSDKNKSSTPILMW